MKFHPGTLPAELDAAGLVGAAAAVERLSRAAFWALSLHMEWTVACTASPPDPAKVRSCWEALTQANAELFVAADATEHWEPGRNHPDDRPGGLVHRAMFNQVREERDRAVKAQALLAAKIEEKQAELDRRLADDPLGRQLAVREGEAP